MYSRLSFWGCEVRAVEIFGSSLGLGGAIAIPRGSALVICLTHLNIISQWLQTSHFCSFPAIVGSLTHDS